MTLIKLKPLRAPTQYSRINKVDTQTTKCLETSRKESFIGKLVWLSGSPGMGKSTSAQYLAKDHGFVYYEADAFGLLLNPFNTLESDNPSLATSSQRVLKGELLT